MSDPSKVNAIKDQVIGTLEESVGYIVGSTNLENQGRQQKEHGLAEYKAAQEKDEQKCEKPKDDKDVPFQEKIKEKVGTVVETARDTLNNLTGGEVQQKEEAIKQKVDNVKERVEGAVQTARGTLNNLTGGEVQQKEKSNDNKSSQKDEDKSQKSEKPKDDPKMIQVKPITRTIDSRVDSSAANPQSRL
eukprot:TRINITY_DN6441_c0_g1_i1.p1 TRINITY_DN6441_c0_g1~~TRINITY_DN6441_c0_g1_i1.p1  ORF type:complete len:189 (+),score=65.94 TRINITY_DN6441_c0_g1_i1:48-614(+)